MVANQKAFCEQNRATTKRVSERGREREREREFQEEEKMSLYKHFIFAKARHSVSSLSQASSNRKSYLIIAKHLQQFFFLSIFEMRINI